MAPGNATPSLGCNLNGMKTDGPKILPIGQGTHEKQMIQQLLDAGYEGDFGILGHVADADVHRIVKQNLDGLKSLWSTNE